QATTSTARVTRRGLTLGVPGGPLASAPAGVSQPLPSVLCRLPGRDIAGGLVSVLMDFVVVRVWAGLAARRDHAGCRAAWYGCCSGGAHVMNGPEHYRRAEEILGSISRAAPTAEEI